MNIPLANKIPNPDDFEEAFGCDCNIDKDLVQTCIFKDKSNKEIRLVFGLIDNSLELTISSDGMKLMELYDEFLMDVTINSESQLIIIDLGVDQKIDLIQIHVWPYASINITSMKQ